MSRDVEHAFWHYWQPGRHVDIQAEEVLAYDAYCKRARRPGSKYRLLLLRLAMDANEIETIYGDSERAVCWTAIDTLGEALNTSRRTLQRLLGELAYWNELDIRPCTGHCVESSYNHHGTNHYILPLPEGAQRWGRRTRKQARERVQNETRKARLSKATGAKKKPRARAGKVQARRA